MKKIVIKNIKNKIIGALLITGLLFNSCSKDFLEPDLQNSTEVHKTKINTVKTLQSFLNGTYRIMEYDEAFGRDVIVYGDVMGGDIAFANGMSNRFVVNSQFNMNKADAYAENTWRRLYKTIMNANIVINTDISKFELDGYASYADMEKEANHIKGQAYAIRAIAYFELVKLYGQQYTQDQELGVSLITTESLEIQKPTRATLTECYTQIENDFSQSLTLIKDSNSGGVYLTKPAIKGIMVRYYMWREDYANAYQYAEQARTEGNGSVTPAPLYELIWTLNGMGAYFELSFDATTSFATNSLPYIYHPLGYGDIVLQESFYNSFDPADIRKAMIKKEDAFYYLYGKYPEINKVSNQKFIRYEEILLNQVEAILQGGGGNPTEALDLYNSLITQRGLSAVSSVTLDDLKAEKGKELVGEGQRIWDLLRWDKQLTAHSIEGSSTNVIPFGDYRLAFPIPQAEMDANSNMVQNKGY